MDYITYTLENCLAISKLMADHAIILLAILPNNKSQKIYEEESELYNNFYLGALTFSFNKISKKFLTSEILMTNYSVFMLNKTKELYKIVGNVEVDISTKNLILHSKEPLSNFSEADLVKTREINISLLNHLNNSINILKNINVLIKDGKEEILFFKNFLEHLIDEIEIFIYTLEFLEREMSFTPTYVYKCNYYFNIVSKEHVNYIKNMSFPVNTKYLSEVNYCESNFNNLVKLFDDNITPAVLDNLSRQTKKANSEFAYCNSELMHGLMLNTVYIAIVPLLSDHILRETNYINYQLSSFELMA